MTLIFAADDAMKTEKNDVSLCKVDVNIKRTEQRLLAVSASLNLHRNTFKETLYSKFYFKIKCGKSRGMQEIVSIMDVWCG